MGLHVKQFLVVDFVVFVARALLVLIVIFQQVFFFCAFEHFLFLFKQFSIIILVMKKSNSCASNPCGMNRTCQTLNRNEYRCLWMSKQKCRSWSKKKKKSLTNICPLFRYWQNNAKTILSLSFFFLILKIYIQLFFSS